MSSRVGTLEFAALCFSAVLVVETGGYVFLPASIVGQALHDRCIKDEALIPMIFVAACPAKYVAMTRGHSITTALLRATLDTALRLILVQ